jgi:hypothetical protein
MVLDRKIDNQALRYLLGICMIALSIYVFYILASMRSSPELFLVPNVVNSTGGPCTVVDAERFSACVPVGIECSPRNGRLELYSATDRIRGAIEIMGRLPQEKAWKDSLHKPFIRAFIGDVGGMGTYELMDTILRRRYNPSLMGAKAILIPPWMKNVPGALILVPSGDKGIIFYTPMRSLGLTFRQGAILMLSIKGHVSKESVAGIMRSIRLTSAEGQGTGSRGSS